VENQQVLPIHSRFPMNNSFITKAERI